MSDRWRQHLHKLQAGKHATLMGVKMNFKEWVDKNLKASQSAYSAARAAWDYLTNCANESVQVRPSASHVQPDQPPLNIPDRGSAS
jgi:hypothetical protein